jgi:hypothetical protein
MLVLAIFDMWAVQLLHLGPIKTIKNGPILVLAIFVIDVRDHEKRDT